MLVARQSKYLGSNASKAAARRPDAVNRASVVAHPNIALAKYWGKLAGGSNLPAMPSLSVTLNGVATRTCICFDPALERDALELNGQELEGEPLTRVCELLNRVREAAGEQRFAKVRSTNDFPTASGLASSAAGFAALALAAVRALGLDWSPEQVSDLARRSSVSAARSVFGGFVELSRPRGRADFLAATPLVAAEHLPLRVLICVTSERAKPVSSSVGMMHTLASPYFKSWQTEATRLYRLLRRALLTRDFEQLGELAESSALAMHAAAIAARLLYWNGATVEALSSVRALRAEGLPVFATIDAGPHVKVLVQPHRVAEALPRLAAVSGVLRVIECAVGEGASLATDEES